MNILFLTIGRMDSIEDHSLYPDLLRQFRDHGHQVYVVSPNEKRMGKQTQHVRENSAQLLQVKIGNLTKCGIIEKGISTLRITGQFKRGIKKFFPGVKFDLVLYSTPPITLAPVVQYIKKRDGAKTYLLLKDIFPQNAVDIGIMTKSGIKGLLYRYFRRKESQLYALSDRIGCMSEANRQYIIRHNPEIKPETVEVGPNSIEVMDTSLTPVEREEMLRKYDIPLDKTVFVYGGNFGKPQCISFVAQCLKTQLKNPDVFFLLVGDGTDYKKMEAFFQEEKPSNMKLMQRLPKEDYDRMVAACDVGMIFLDHRFTIPNFPSRLLIYMQAGLPVLACTDPNTDVGQVITEGGFGWWCESNDPANFSGTMAAIDLTRLREAGNQGTAYLKKHYTAAQAYEIIAKGF